MNRIEEIRAREQAATPGPWTAIISPFDSNGDLIDICSELIVGKTLGECTVAQEVSKDSANFIAHARQDIPYLLSEVDRLTAELEQYRKQESDVPNCWCCSQVKNIQIFFRGQRMASPKHCPECGKKFQEDKQPESYQEK